MSKEAITTSFCVDQVFAEMAEGNLANEELTYPFFKIMAQDIASEKKRIGGDWVVTMALPTRKMRDVIKEECDAIFVIMIINEEVQAQRIKERHSEGDEAMDQSTIGQVSH